MSNRSRSRWVWRVLGICLLATISFFGTRSWLLMAGSQTQQIGLNTFGNQYPASVPPESGAVLLPTTNTLPLMPAQNAGPLSRQPVNVQSPVSTLTNQSQQSLPILPSGVPRLTSHTNTIAAESPLSTLPGSRVSRQSYPALPYARPVATTVSSKVAELLSELRSMKDQDSEDKRKLMSELSQTLEREFDRKHQQHQQAIARLEGQLEEARQLYKKRETNKSEIIERRIAQLLGQSDDLAWDVAGTAPRPYLDQANLNLPQLLRPATSPSPASNQSRTMFAITCEHRDVVLVQRLLQTQFANQPNLDFLAYKDQKQLFGLADQTAIDSGIIKKIQSMVDSLNLDQFQPQRNNNQLPTRDNGNFSQPAPAAPATEFTNPNFANPRVDEDSTPIQQVPIRNPRLSDNRNPTESTSPVPATGFSGFSNQPAPSNFSQHPNQLPHNIDSNRGKFDNANSTQPPKRYVPETRNVPHPNASGTPIAVEPPSDNIPAQSADSLDRVLLTLKITVLNENQIKLEMLPNHFQPFPTSPVPMNQLSQQLKQIKPSQVDAVEILFVDKSETAIVSTLIEKVSFLKPSLISSNIPKLSYIPSATGESLAASPSELPASSEKETSPADSADVQTSEKAAEDQTASDQNQDPLTPTRPRGEDGVGE